MVDEHKPPGLPAWQGAALAAGLAASLCVATLVASGVPLERLGVYFDGHLYIQIARSYPLPFGPGAGLYAGHAPGYPALIALTHALLPDASFQWAEVAVLVSWAGTAASAALFHMLTRAWGVSSIWPTILFVAAQPRWLVVGTAAHAEPLAMAFALAALLAFARDRTGWSLVFLSLATLCRFPALTLGLPLAWGMLVERRHRNLRTFLWLASPFAVLGLLHLYLAARMPGFVSIWHAHQPLWPTRWVSPLETLFRSYPWNPALPLREVTYGTLTFYAVAVVLALRPSLRHGRVLALWILAASALPLSLSGGWGVQDFPRLAVLGWPAAVLVFWLAIGARLPRAAIAGLAAAGLVFSVWFAGKQVRRGVDLQSQRQPHVTRMLERIDSDEPVWLSKFNPPDSPSREAPPDPPR